VVGYDDDDPCDAVHSMRHCVLTGALLFLYVIASFESVEGEEVEVRKLRVG
jgi:hypothetical protein